MTKNDVRAVALFFYYSLLDDQLALRATDKAIKRLNRLEVGTTEPNVVQAEMARSIQAQNIVRICYRLWRRIERFAVRGGSGGTPTTHWTLPENLDLAPWRQFQREGHGDDVIAVIWSKIIGYSDQDIALGLEITPGTVRYRSARGIRLLGQTNRLGKYVGI